MSDHADILDRIVQSDESLIFKVEYQQLSEPERVFFCVWSLIAEVGNGGFSAVFYNSTGDHCQDILKSLQQNGADTTAALLKRAMAIFPKGQPSPDFRTREAQYEKLGDETEEHWETCDNEFFGQDHESTLWELLYDYVVAHRDEVRGATTVLGA